MGQLLQAHGGGKWWWQWLPPMLLMFCSLSVALLGEWGGEWLRFQRGEILTGEWWRLFSGHLAHLGWAHLWINFAGLLLVWILVGRAMALRHWWWFIPFCMLVISCGLLWWLPGLVWYVGLSGLLHGMLLAGGLQLALRGEREAQLLLLILMGKIGWELWQGPLPGSREASGGEVVVQAHALGAASGLLYVGLLRLLASVALLRQRSS